jgi:AraC-like DNA-binding protein
MLAISPEESQAAEREFTKLPQPKKLLQPKWSVDDVQTAVNRVLRRLTPDATAIPELDFRVQTVVNELIADSSEHVSLQVLAARVRLSESRLAHLFRYEVGIPIRQYRLSLRMHEAITQIASGKSLTESAHMAGFADSSQFCRICKRMFGNSPSNLPGFALLT